MSTDKNFRNIDPHLIETTYKMDFNNCDGKIYDMYVKLSNQHKKLYTENPSSLPSPNPISAPKSKFFEELDRITNDKEKEHDRVMRERIATDFVQIWKELISEWSFYPKAKECIIKLKDFMLQEVKQKFEQEENMTVICLCSNEYGETKYKFIRN